jgi:hypothetical protein
MKGRQMRLLRSPVTGERGGKGRMQLLALYGREFSAKGGWKKNDNKTTVQKKL